MKKTLCISMMISALAHISHATELETQPYSYEEPDYPCECCNETPRDCLMRARTQEEWQEWEVRNPESNWTTDCTKQNTTHIKRRSRIIGKWPKKKSNPKALSPLQELLASLPKEKSKKNGAKAVSQWLRQFIIEKITHK